MQYFKKIQLIFTVENKKVERRCLALFFSCLVILGIAVHRDYGISWDEPDSRTLGIVNVMYLGKIFGISAIEQSQEFSQYQKFELNAYKDKDYGVLFEAPAVLLERVLRISDEQHIYYFRHLLTYFVSLLGVYAIYRLSQRRFQDWRIGLLSALFFILTPRMFAESFYNDKDLVFLAFFTLGLNALIAFVQLPTKRLAMLFALTTALAMNIRLMAIILPVMALFVLLSQVYLRRLSIRQIIMPLLVYGLMSLVLTVLLWPWLWSDPLGHLAIAFSNMRQFRWFGFPFYFGQYWPIKELPWHYLIVSIVITSPLWILILWLSGAIQTLYEWIKRRAVLWTNFEQMQDMIFLGVFLLPIIAIVIMHSVVYNGWRHVYFIYPAMILIATKGLVGLWNLASLLREKVHIRFAKGLLTLLVVAFCLSSLQWMIFSHPFQNVYFNYLAGPNWKDLWEVDYWGLSNRKALQSIAKIDARPSLLIWPGSNTPLYYALKLLPEADRNRLAITSHEEEAHYIVTNFHGNQEDYEKSGRGVLIEQFFIGPQLIYAIYQRKP